VNQRDVTNAGRVVDEVIADGDVSSAGALLRWLDVGTRRQVALRGVEAARAADGLRLATDLGQTSRQESTGYVALAGVGLLVALSLALLAARSITRPLRSLTDAADHLAEERLPRLVDALRNPGDDDERYLAVTIEPIEVGSDDELAHLGRAFNTVQAVAVDVAAQQADLLRKGISDLYVNLARRNQSLVERQILLLDRLESGEEDPEVLEHLFLLDHLATRMRRNAESLLVLAGAESGSRRARPTDVVDVVRAALSEVEAYERVELGALAPATVQGLAVSDVAHLVAELLENATSFSPPDTTVRVDGIRVGGSYQLVITDHGLGMPAAQLDELNALLRDPPVTGLALGRSLGCLVAARLAARHGITVRLRPAERGGVAAFVVLPRAALAADEPVPAPGLALDTLAALDHHLPVAPVAPPAPTVDLDDVREAAPAMVGWATEEPRPERLRDALPSGEVFEAGLRTLLTGVPPRVEPEGPAHQQTEGPAVAEAAAAVTDVEPRPSADHQALVRRVPGATGSGQAAASSAERARRSPDEVRTILMKYRSGLRAGRAAAPGREERP
jgi:signal transduction histidine kinase